MKTTTVIKGCTTRMSLKIERVNDLPDFNSRLDRVGLTFRDGEKRDDHIEILPKY